MIQKYQLKQSNKITQMNICI